MSEFDINSQEHADHHCAMRECLPLLIDFLAERKKSQDRMDAICKTALGAIVSSAVLAVMAALGWVGSLVLAAINHGAQPPTH